MQNLKISKPTVYKYMDLGMPVYYVNNTPYYDMKEVLEWIKTHNKEEGNK
jgi:hypothetical protein